MAKNTKIEWCDATVNLWWGCAKAHTGCKNCYAEYFSDVRYKKGLWGEKALRRRIMSAFKDLAKYQKEAEKENKKTVIFCGSMMDIFEDTKNLNNPSIGYKTTNDLREELFCKISEGLYDNLVFLFLTKRPYNIQKYVPKQWVKQPKNVWYGTSVSDSATAAEYAFDLQHCMGKDQKLFLSIEPQVGAIDNLELSANEMRSEISWVIQGGESGHGRRPFNVGWAYTMRDLCKEAGVPYFFKQIDKKTPVPEDLKMELGFPKF